jgi:hypothetical protein
MVKLLSAVLRPILALVPCMGKTPHSLPAFNPLKFQRGRLLLLAMKTNLYEQRKRFES